MYVNKHLDNEVILKKIAYQPLLGNFFFEFFFLMFFFYNLFVYVLCKCISKNLDIGAIPIFFVLSKR